MPCYLTIGGSDKDLRIITEIYIDYVLWRRMNRAILVEAQILSPLQLQEILG